MRIAAVICLCLLLSSATAYARAQAQAAPPESQQPKFGPPKQTASIDCLPSSLSKKLDEELRGRKIQGIAIFASKAGNPICSVGSGFADVKRKRPATVDTPFAVASITKAFVGTDLALLANKGAVDLGSPANAYLRGPRLHSPFWDPAKATVAMLAGHTAGLTSYERTCPVDNPICKPSLQTAIAKFGILFWPPGDHFDYSNLGYGILGEVVENASKKPLSRELDDALFHPLTLTNCYLHETGPLRDDSAVSYVNPTHGVSPPEVSDTPGSSSAYCSARDLTRFGETLLGQHRESWPAVPADLVFRSFSASAGVHYSFGWFERSANGHSAYMAQGGTDRAFAILEIVPDSDLVIAVVANTGTDFPSDVVKEMIRMTTTPKQIPPEPETPQTSSGRPNLSGRWTGKVRTAPKEKSVALEIVSAHDVRLTLASRSLNCTNVELRPERLYCLGQGGLLTEQASSAVTFDFEVYLHGNKLLGAATTSGTTQLPFVVSLIRSGR